MKKRCLMIFLGCMGRGGAERVISHIANYFVKKDWDVWIGMLLFNTVEYELDSRIHIVDLTGGGQSRLKRLPGWLFGIRKLIKDVNPDTVLSFAARINIITQLACAGMRQKIIVSERNDPRYDGRGKVTDLFTKLLYPRANAVVFQTKRAEEYFKEIGLINGYIIPNPISVQCHANGMKFGKIVTAGRLTPQKNQRMLISAFSKIVKKYPDTQLYIYGEGNLREELEKQIEELELNGRVIMPGNISDIHNKISDANIFVLPSNFEGLSNMLLEAMMMGLPCISTNCAGADEYITNGKNGLLVNTGDEKAIEEAMCTFLQNPELAKKCGTNAAKASESFDAENVLKQWWRVIC